MGNFTGKKREVVKLFFFIGASVSKSWEKSRIVMPGLYLNSLSQGQKPQQGEDVQHSHPMHMRVKCLLERTQRKYYELPLFHNRINLFMPSTNQP